ncbi:MAG: hypothetical protein IPP83_07715 [Flavobacteriales bacterium]|nr:hypothetical protein [Flavobacteriales bacterium]
MEAKRKWKPKKSKYDVELTAFEEEAIKGLYDGKPLIGDGGIFHRDDQEDRSGQLEG